MPNRQSTTATTMDEFDRWLLNRLQDGIAVCEEPFAIIATEFGCSQATVLGRLQGYLDNGILTRFGPMYRVDAMGGAYLLAAMSVPVADFEHVASLLDSFPTVAHNYEREHELNMWFVLAVANEEDLPIACQDIEKKTGYRVYGFAKEKEYFVDLRFPL